VEEALPLVGDSEELLPEIERTFSMQAPCDLRHCHAVGDLHEFLIATTRRATSGKMAMGSRSSAVSPSAGKPWCKKNRAAQRKKALEEMERGSPRAVARQCARAEE